MGTDIPMMGRITVVALLVGSCAHAPAPLPERTILHRQEYLTDEASEVSGDLQHVKDGVWCSDDDALSIPIIPYPDGPVSISDRYHGWGVTTLFDMFDAHESVLEIIRTSIPAGWTEADMTAHILEGVHKAAALGGDVVTTEMVLLAGRRQIQQITRLPDYAGRASARDLWLLPGISSVHTPEACRVDRHLVEHGYYIELVAVAYRVSPPHDRCKVAEEMATWAAEHIEVGKGCGPARSPR
jgi:hypothetical protein